MLCSGAICSQMTICRGNHYEPKGVRRYTRDAIGAKLWVPCPTLTGDAASLLVLAALLILPARRSPTKRNMGIGNDKANPRPQPRKRDEGRGGWMRSFDSSM
ncbi:hypothetical protein N9L68_09080 [bacterium]|nr:hypothetical protein [bacterium]